MSTLFIYPRLIKFSLLNGNNKIYNILDRILSSFFLFFLVLIGCLTVPSPLFLSVLQCR
jgi:hypothetical protein